MRQTLLVVYLIPEFKSPGVQRAQNFKIKSEADRSLTKKVSEINMQHSQADWASALHSLWCLIITFKTHLPPQPVLCVSSAINHRGISLGWLLLPYQ